MWREWVKKSKVLLIPALSVMLLLQGCAVMNEIAGTFASLKRLQFRLGAISDFTLAGIRVSRISSLESFTVADGLRLLAAFRNRSLPARFLLQVEARNPNDGTGGSPRTVSTLTRFDWRLLIDDRPTISGGIDAPLEIPGTGDVSFIPLGIELDLYEFFGHKGYEDILRLALALGGQDNDITRVALDAQPGVSTPFGEITYPDRITIISREFR